ncbi:MAG: tetratricopeptide repeat protein, partial [Proteobacteria bacterium]|nr:tetratricopeptide repeat protein [Pseudomonadota bacterium]
DIFAIQDEIANSIVDALRDTLGIENADTVITVAAATSNLDAYDLFLKGREMFIARSRENLPPAIEIAEQAVELDPDFARAWELLAALYSVAPSWGVGGDDYLELSREAVDRALALEPNLAFAYGIKSQNMRGRDGYVNWTETMALINKSLELDPKNPTLALWRGINYHRLGFHDQAEYDFDRCLELDPGYENCTNHRTMIFFNKGDVDIGMARFDEQHANARARTTHWYQYQVPDLVRKGDLRAARLTAGSVLHDNPVINAWLTALGHPDEDQSERIDLLSTQMTESSRAAQFVWLTIGAYDRVEADYFAHIAMWRSDQKDFRGSPDFKRVARDSGFEEYWRAHGFPPQCRAVGDDDFECD